MEKYGDQVPKYVICFGPYKIKDHWCRITSYNKGVSKVYVYLKIQYANCKSSYSANSNWYTLVYKAEKKPQRKKTLNKSKAKVIETNEKRDKAYNEASSA